MKLFLSQNPNFVLYSNLIFLYSSRHLVDLWTTTTQALSHVVSKRPVRGALVSYIRRSWYHILSSPLKEITPKTPSLKPYHDNASFTHMCISILLVHQNKPPIIRPSSRSVDHRPLPPSNSHPSGIHSPLASTSHLTYRCPPLLLYLKLSFCSLTIKCNSVSKKL